MLSPRRTVVPPPDAPRWADAELSPRQFAALSEFITSTCGIQLAPPKRVMLQSRLRRRLRALDLPDLDSYCQLAFQPGSAELRELIDAVTTNKTDFFREADHFDHLVEHVLPRIGTDLGAGTSRRLRAWSAGCSTGEEPYTLAMVLAEHARNEPGFAYSILATDICTSVLDHARRAIYDEARVQPVPADMRDRYLLRSKDRDEPTVRIVPELRARVEFRRVNFLDQELGVEGPVDLIFCRNVFIYFDRATQEAILRKFCRLLAPGGFLFLGHSESITGMQLPLSTVRPTIFRRNAGH